MRAYPLATLVTHGADGLTANHIPLHFSPDPAPHGTLYGHIARANPLARPGSANGDVLAVFQGPEAYVSPSWYATKAETGKVVPTWNYAVVHAHGTLRLVDDPAWLRARLEELTSAQEGAFATPWQVGDAPDDYIEKLLRAIVGVEIAVTSLVGKWKVSQNQPDANRAGVVDGLTSRGAADMAALVAGGTPPTRRESG